jgi:hypothetical protein
MLRRRRDREQPSTSSPYETYSELRGLALGAVSSGLEQPGAEHPRVSGVVIDVPSGGSYATVVALTDDTTSMYTSVGGGTIGAGQHVGVAAATHALLAAVDAQLDEFTDPQDASLPPAGTVRFHVLAESGGHTKDVPEDVFWGRASDPLMPVIVAAQGVITAMREASPE